ncbi:MAG: glycerate kinase [Bacteroidales bacterium]|nr:glycerate kinase [Bacteroidales bacterium]MCF8336564.1 glycerate kinase [Bacteroidales bacterium]
MISSLPKQLLNIPGTHVPERVVGIDEGLGQFRLSLLELVNLFFDASAGNQAVDKDVFLLADGGEGTVDALVAAAGGTKTKVHVHDPLMREIEAEYGIIHNDTAVIEMAAASGLELLSREERNPIITTTFGTGELIREAIQKCYSRIIVGVGGSSTNSGAGMAEALGAKLYNKESEEINKGGTRWAN